MACGCCCDPCNEDRLDCDRCCKCVPKAFCARFVPDDPEECSESSQIMERQEFFDAENDYTQSVYSGAFGVTVTLEYDAYEDACYWHVVRSGTDFDERYDIGYGTGCRNPSFSIPVSDPYCPGTIEITRYEETKVPFVSDYSECWDFFCGNCRCACKTLCVTIVENAIPFPIVEIEEWEWNGNGWGDAILSRDEETGACVLTYEDFDPIVLSGCGRNVEFDFSDSYIHIRAICKACNCGAVGGCCPDNIQLPLVLNAHVDGGPDCCGAFDLPLIWDQIDTVWESPFNLAMCGHECRLRLSCTSPLWTLAFEGGSCLVQSVNAAEETDCNPLNPSFSVPANGINCCGGIMGGILSVTITE